MNKNHKDLITKCIKNDRNSQKEFYTMFYPRLMAVSLRMSPDRETAKDLLQDSYIKMYNRLKTLKGYDEAVVYSWCKSIVSNTIIDYLRKPANKIKVFELDGDDEYGSKISRYDKEIEFKGYDTTLLNIKNLEPSDVMEAIETLPRQYKVVFNLVIEGYTHQEIADKLGIVVGTSKSNYAKARYRLMDQLNEIGEEEEYKLHFELN